MAEPFLSIRSVAMPLVRDNIDTDQIIPSREMKTTGKTGLADGLFAGWRYTEIGGRELVPDFVLNQPEYASSQIILGGANFGCGSSREHAVWALAEYGFRAIIAPSFAPIFAGNCARNGILPVVMESDIIAEIVESGQPITIDLSAQMVRLDGGTSWNFEIDSESKTMLLEGLDGIGLTQQRSAEIASWISIDRNRRPWIYLGAQS